MEELKSSKSISIYSDSRIEISIWAKSGILIDLAIRGKSGAPASKIGIPPGNVIFFLPFGRSSTKYPPKSKETSNWLSEIIFTFHSGSEGSALPTSTHSLPKRLPNANMLII